MVKSTIPIVVVFFFIVFVIVIFTVLFFLFPRKEIIVENDCPTFGSLTTECRDININDYPFQQILFKNAVIKTNDNYYLTGQGLSITQEPIPNWSSDDNEIYCPFGSLAVQNGEVVFGQTQLTFYDGRNILFLENNIFYCAYHQNNQIMARQIKIEEYYYSTFSYFTLE